MGWLEVLKMVCGSMFTTALAVIVGVVIVKKILFRVWARRRGFAGHGGGGCGPSGHGRFGGWGRGRWGGGGGFARGPRAFLRGLFMRLDTSPSQEKVIVAAVTEVREAASRAKEIAALAREDIARAMRADVIDEAALSSAQAKAERATSDMRVAIAEALRHIHEVLDPAQRAKIADWLSMGPGFFGGDGGGGGPYRSVSI